MPLRGRRFVCGTCRSAAGASSTRAASSLSSSAANLRCNPSYFHLFEPGAVGEPVYVGDSPYDHDLRATNVYAFSGAPATHLINAEGVMLLIRGPECQGPPSSGARPSP